MIDDSRPILESKIEQLEEEIRYLKSENARLRVQLTSLFPINGVGTFTSKPPLNTKWNERG